MSTINYLLKNEGLLAFLGVIELAIYVTVQIRVMNTIIILNAHFRKKNDRNNYPFEYYIKHNTQKHHDLFCSTEYHIISKISFFKTIGLLFN